MCVVKTPKVSPTDPSQKPIQPTIIRNPILDSIAGGKIQRTGRSSLRIDRGTTRTPMTPLAIPTLAAGSRGGGGSMTRPDTNIDTGRYIPSDFGRISPRGF